MLIPWNRLRLPGISSWLQATDKDTQTTNNNFKNKFKKTRTKTHPEEDDNPNQRRWHQEIKNVNTINRSALNRSIRGHNYAGAYFNHQLKEALVQIEKLERRL